MNPVPEAILRFYPDRLFECPKCGVSLDRGIRGTRLEECESDREFAAAGRGLATFHNLSRDAGELLSPKKVIKKLTGWVELIRNEGILLDALPDLPKLKKSLSKSFPEDLQQSWIHGDLKPEHVFIHDRQVRFIDRDALKRGFTLLDVANLVNHLEWRLEDSDRRIRLLLEAYERESRGIDSQNLQIARLYSALRTIRNRVAEYRDKASGSIKQPQQTLALIWSEISS